MKEVFDAVNQVFDFVVPIADFLWGFPTNFDWYASIPILGNLSFAIVILIGSGIFFSIKTGFIQVTHFRKGLRILIDRKTAAVGITPLAAFFLSSAMRVGPGNIMGVTGALLLAVPVHCSGCGSVPFSVWQRHLWKPHWRRFSKKEKAMNW